MKANLRNSRFAIVGIAYLVSLAAAFALTRPEAAQANIMAPWAAGAFLVLFFGPYLLPVGCTTGFLPGLGALGGLAAILPFYVAHVVFLSILSRHTSLWRRLGRFGERARKIAVVLMALLSAAGVWYELPTVTRYELTVGGGKIPPDGIRLAVVQAQDPDIVLLVGDIFDDRLPDDNTMAFVSAIARDYPCFFVFGNHEHWSGRIHEMSDALKAAGVTVLKGNAKTIRAKGVEIDLCGIDDPTYMPGEEWLGQLAAVAAVTAGSPHLKILLSHRAEYAGEYAKYDFDLVFSGHLHGGQWRIPGLGLGIYSPSAGGPRSGERHIFPRRAGGAYALGNNSTLVVSRGLARESAPLPRFFNHPELVVVNLKPQKPSATNP